MNASITSLVPYASKKQLKQWIKVDKKTELQCLRELVLRRWGSTYLNLKGEMEDKAWFNLLLLFKLNFEGTAKVVQSNNLVLLNLFWGRGLLPKLDVWIWQAFVADAVNSLAFLVEKGFKVSKDLFDSAIESGAFNCVQWLVSKGFKFDDNSADLAFKGRVSLFNHPNIKEELETLTLTKRFINLSQWMAENFNLFPAIPRTLFEFLQMKIKIIRDGALRSFFESLWYFDEKDHVYLEFDNLLICKGRDDLDWAINMDLMEVVKVFVTSLKMVPTFYNCLSPEMVQMFVDNNVPFPHLEEIHNNFLNRFDLNQEEQNLKVNVGEAVFNEDISFLEWAATNKKIYPLESHLRDAIFFNNIKVLKWAVAHGLEIPIPHPADVCGFIEMSRIIDFASLRFVLKRGFIPSIQSLNEFAESGIIRLLLIFSEYGFLPDKQGARLAKNEEHDDVVNWLALKGVQIGEGEE